jgi:hypothetical protein
MLEWPEVKAYLVSPCRASYILATVAVKILLFELSVFLTLALSSVDRALGGDMVNGVSKIERYPRNRRPVRIGYTASIHLNDDTAPSRDYVNPDNVDSSDL